ncbi:Mitochondrial proton/calcium exchanger protein [Glycine max]|nr:Mitochondrial proton/calcium exchanger protein [Glycine max]
MSICNYEKWTGKKLFTVNKDDLVAYPALRFISPSSFRVSSFGFRSNKIELVYLSRLEWLSQCTRNISMASTDQSGLASNNKGTTKQKKEASPQECDEAIEGLSSIKAKAKAKKMQEPQKSADSIIKKLWVKILGIGLAFRTIMSMSKISSRLLLKLAGGKSLSRRERQQLTRTTIDIFRLVPFAVFIIVPFVELLLAVFLKLFPNMLPSIFQDKMKELVILLYSSNNTCLTTIEALKRRLNARIEYAKFLQDTVKEMAK